MSATDPAWHDQSPLYHDNDANACAFSTRILSIRIGDWPIYAFMMAFGQILSVNSYQITLLTGEPSQTTNKLYIIGSVYLATSIMWWLMIRNFKSLYSITLPWLFFGLAFMILGITGFLPDDVQGTVQMVATVLYAAGASSGATMFALNFGDEGRCSILFFHLLRFEKLTRFV